MNKIGYYKDTLDQINHLKNDDLEILYFSCIRVMKQRKIFSSVKQKLKTHRLKATIVENSLNIKSINTNKYKLNPKTNESCLIDILKDDWNYLFNNEYDKRKDYYVYYHSYPNRNNAMWKNKDERIEFFGEPFYVGKGKGNRYKSKTRNRVHTNIINNIIENGFYEDDVFHIFKDNLDEKDALILESKLITFLGCKNELKNLHITGRNGGLLVNTDYGKRPKWIDNKLNKI